MKKTFLSLLTMLLIIIACNKETINTDSIDQAEQELVNLENGSANMRSSCLQKLTYAIMMMKQVHGV